MRVLNLLPLLLCCCTLLVYSAEQKHHAAAGKNAQHSSTGSSRHLHADPEKRYTTPQWDKEFSTGEWDYMDAVPLERVRLAGIGSGMTNLYGIPSNATILDVGCAEGILSDYLSDKQKKNYIGVDISKVAIDRAMKKRGAPMTWAVSKAHEYTPPRKVDVIVFSEVLMYVSHEDILKQYEKYLTPNGKIIVSLYREDKTQGKYSEVKDYSRDRYELLDDFEIIGTTRNPDPTKVHIRIDVFQLKKI
jgi:2-polyprenyl-3-methyl-5-hydroxy-6-metoxy-1,4-benzoquinol methylase